MRRYIRNNPRRSWFVTLCVGMGGMMGWEESRALLEMLPVQALLLICGGMIVLCYKRLDDHERKDVEVERRLNGVDGRVDSLEAKVENNTNLLVIVAKKLGVEQEMIDGIIGRK